MDNGQETRARRGIGRRVSERRRSLTQADVVERVRRMMRTRRAAKFSS